MEMPKHISGDGYKATINYDEYCDGPRGWGNLGVIVTALRHYVFEENLPRDSGNIWTAFLNYIKEREYTGDSVNDNAVEKWIEKNVYVLDVYAYIHGGITINTTGYRCPWDSGQAGYIYTTKERARKWFGVKYITKKIEKEIYDRLEYEITELDNYLTNEYYILCVECNGEEEKCYGCIDHEPDEEEIVRDYCND